MNGRMITIAIATTLSLGSLSMAMAKVGEWATTPVPATSIEDASRRPRGESRSLASYLVLTRLQHLGHAADAADGAIKFIAYFLLSTRAVDVICSAEGVDVRAAVVAFSDRHSALYHQASAILAAEGLNADRLWQLFEDTLVDAGRTQLAAVSSSPAGEPAAACRALADGRVRWAEVRAYETNYPRLYRMLVAE